MTTNEREQLNAEAGNGYLAPRCPGLAGHFRFKNFLRTADLPHNWNRNNPDFREVSLHGKLFSVEIRCLSVRARKGFAGLRV